MTQKEQMLIVALMSFGSLVGFWLGYLVVMGIKIPEPVNSIAGWFMAFGFVSMAMLGAFMLATLIFTKSTG